MITEHFFEDRLPLHASVSCKFKYNAVQRLSLPIGLSYLQLSPDHLVPRPYDLNLLILLIDDLNRFHQRIVIWAFLLHQVVNALWQPSQFVGSYIPFFVPCRDPSVYLICLRVHAVRTADPLGRQKLRFLDQLPHFVGPVESQMGSGQLLRLCGSSLPSCAFGDQ